AGRRGGRLGLAPRVDVVVLQGLLELAGAIGRVAVDLGPLPVTSVFVGVADIVLVGEEVVDELRGHGGVTGAVRVDGGVALVAVEASGLGLVAVARLGIHGGDDPVLGHLAGDAEHAVVAL